MRKEKKVLHLMKDEKFIDYFIEQSEEIAPEGSIYWIIQNKEDSKLKYINSSFIKQINWAKHNIHALTREANQFETVILHSFFFSHLNSFLQGLRKDIKIIWMFWGGDGYKFTSVEKRWYLPLTWQYKKNILKGDSGIIKSIAYELNLFRLRWIKSRAIRALIKRVNICATWIKYDFEMIRHVNPKMKWAYYSYFTAQQMALEELEPQCLNLNRLWLGNSATDTNNHFDALYYLKEINWQGEVIVPLSYGSKMYAEDVVRYGKQHFGERFISLTEFMPLNHYQQYMNSCGIVWMNHVRQQAAGNTLAALYMGKVVIMNVNNNLYKILRDWGICFAKQNILESTTEINNETYSGNRDIVITHFSKKESLTALKKLYHIQSNLIR